MFPAPRAGRLQFEIKDDVMLFGELENVFEGGDAFACEFAAEPRTGIEAAKLVQREIVDSSMSVGCAVDGLVMDCDKTRIACELQIGLDEGGTEGHSAAERGKSVLWRVP